ncbi:MAG: hypothetical protein JNL83_33725 [Myxococcales bacterium]|nr:hypothetical protein [Myxococcales bacterium]
MQQVSAQNVLVLDASFGGMSLGALDRYLSDMRAWVLQSCRMALAAGTACGRIGTLPGALLEALVGACGASGDAARFVASGEDVPHRLLARQLGLSRLGSAIMVLAAAPRLWGDLAQLYSNIGFTGKAIVEEGLLAALLGCDRGAIERELDPGAPLTVTGVCRLGPGARPTAPVIVHAMVVRRLAGEKVHDARPRLA